MKRFVLVALLVLCAGRAESQVRYGAGLGFGTAGLSALGHVGKQVTPRRLMGVEAGLWFIPGNALITTTWLHELRASTGSGVQLKGGLGLSLWQKPDEGDIIFNEWDVGGAFTAGLGYTARTFRRASLTWDLNFILTTPFDNVHQDFRSMWRVTMGINW